MFAVEAGEGSYPQSVVKLANEKSSARFRISQPRENASIAQCFRQRSASDEKYFRKHRVRWNPLSALISGSFSGPTPKCCVNRREFFVDPSSGCGYFGFFRVMFTPDSAIFFSHMIFLPAAYCGRKGVSQNGY